MSPNSVPEPYIATPATDWDGSDGNWSTFRISVGTEAGSNAGQNFRVLISTRGSSMWVPTADGCPPEFGHDCPARRGVETFRGQQSLGFQENQSATWIPIHNYNLGLESNLGFRDHGGTFGYDTVRLGFSGDANKLQVNNTLVVEYGEPDYWMGLLGLSDANQTLTGDNSTHSLIMRLNETGTVPSMSYGYTAGAYHRYSRVPGSLVIGGYDNSRFQPPQYSFSFSTDDTRYLSVGLQSVQTNFSLGAKGMGVIDLLSNGHMSVIDSTVSQLWLPEDACNRFQEAFGLTYDAKRNYYLINDTMHDSLRAKNPSLTFQLGHLADPDPDPNEFIRITLPYAAFDHFIGIPVYKNETRYFPIRRAENDTQYTIGRVFLQEAYLTVNYENRSFSLAQATFSDNMPDPDITTIHSANWVEPTATSLSSGAKAGIAIGVISSVLLVFSATYLYWWRPRKQKKKAHNKRPSVVSQAPTYLPSADPPPHYYREGKEPYDPHFGAQQQQQQHMGYERQHSVSEMPAGADNQARRPELDGVNVGGSSYELPAPLKERDEDVVVYEMGVGHEAASDADQDSAEVESEQVERRGSEQRRPSEPTRPPQAESPSA